MTGGGRGGPTAREVVLVVAILAVMGAVAVPRYAAMRAQAREASVRGSLGTIRAALAIQYAKAAVQSGTAAFPDRLDATMFPNGSIPADPVTGRSKVVSSYDGTGGWVYDSATGAVSCNLGAYRAF